MSWFPESKDHLPLTWWKGHPIYLAAYLAIAGVVSMIVTSILMAVDMNLVRALTFSYEGLVQAYRVWTPVSYVLVNGPSLMLLLSAYFFWRFGEDVEKFFGRRTFVKLFTLLVLVTPLMLTLFGLLGARTWTVMGISGVYFGVFLAFATLYPNAQISLILFTLPAWVLAVAIVGVNALISLAARDWAGLVMLACQVLTAYGFVRFEQGRWTMPSLSQVLPGRNKKKGRSSDLTLLPSYREKENTKKPVPAPSNAASVNTSAVSEDIDAILDKISRDGMQSLSPEERRVLEKASERLNKKG